MNTSIKTIYDENFILKFETKYRPLSNLKDILNTCKKN